MLDSKLPEEQEIIATLPRISDHLCDACREHFAKLKDELNLRGIAYQENWRLVRGTRLLHAHDVRSDGRRAWLAERRLRRRALRWTGGVAWRASDEGNRFRDWQRPGDFVDSGKRQSAETARLDVFVAWMGATAYPTAVKIARKLRDAGFTVELPPEEMKFKKSLGLADKLGARYALIVGEDEVASGDYHAEAVGGCRAEEIFRERIDSNG